jgi:hypothetical protein
MKKEFKVGDKVAVDGVDASKMTGMIVDIKENKYIIELDEALPMWFFTTYDITFRFSPLTFIVRVEVENDSRLNLMDDGGASAP